jgi:hypothetical protein
MSTPVVRVTLRISKATADAIRERMPAKGSRTLSEYIRGLVAVDLDWERAFYVNKNGRPKGRRPAAAERQAAKPSRTAQAASAGPDATAGPPPGPEPPPAPSKTPEPSPPEPEDGPLEDPMTPIRRAWRLSGRGYRPGATQAG